MTQTKLASLAGVSQNTVHRALRGMAGVSDETRDKIRSLASAYGYRINSAARNMRTGRTGQVGVLVLDDPSYNFLRTPLLQLLWGVNAGLEEADYVTTMVRLTDVDRQDAEEAKIFREHLLDGVIIANLLPAALQDKISRLVPHHVWLDANVWQPQGCLQRDEVNAGRLAARALIDAGHRRLIHLVRPEPWRGQGELLHYSGQARMDGLFQEAAQAGVELVPFNVPDPPETFDVSKLDQLLDDDAGLFIRRMGDARIIASLNLSGSLKGGWGKTRSIASSDDSFDVDLWWPGLSRVRFDRMSMGRRAAEMMVALLNNHPDEATSVRIRDSFFPGTTIRPVTKAKAQS